LRRLIQLYGFWYGCIGSLCTFAWYVSALFGCALSPSDGWFVGLFTLHCVAAMFTFQTQVRQKWQPFLSATRGQIRLARTLFSLATLNFLVCFGTFMIAANRGYQSLEDKTLPLILISFLLQNTVYIAIHWAYRPENLFPRSFIEAISNPLGTVLKLILPSNKKP